MMRINGATAVTLIGLVGLGSAAAQQDLETQRAALKEIRETAADICYTVEQKGQKGETQLTGEVEAKVAGALAKLADLGVKGSGQISSTEYKGVTQEALGTALAASVNCRQRVFEKLADKMLPSPVIPGQQERKSSETNGSAVVPPGSRRTIIENVRLGMTRSELRSAVPQGVFTVTNNGTPYFTYPASVRLGQGPHVKDVPFEVFTWLQNDRVSSIELRLKKSGLCYERDSKALRNEEARLIMDYFVEFWGRPAGGPVSQQKQLSVPDYVSYTVEEIRFRFRSGIDDVSVAFSNNIGYTQLAPRSALWTCTISIIFSAT